MYRQNNADKIAALLVELIELMTDDKPSEIPVPHEGSNATLLTVEDAAKRLQIGRTRMFDLLKSGEIESVQIGRLRRVHPDALEKYARRLQNQPSTQTE